MVKLDIVEHSENISTVYKSKQHNISIFVNFANGSLPYFKVLNNVNYWDASKEICILFKHCSWFKESNDLKLWKMNEQDKQLLLQILKNPSPCFNNLTNWHVALYKWNNENLDNMLDMKNYFKDKYNPIYRNNSQYLLPTTKLLNYNNLKF